MPKIEVNVQDIIDKIKSKLDFLGVAKVYKGRNKMEGHFVIKFAIDEHRELEIDIDVVMMLANKHYLDNLLDNIYDLNQKSMKRSYEKCRVLV